MIDPTINETFIVNCCHKLNDKKEGEIIIKEIKTVIDATVKQTFIVWCCHKLNNKKERENHKHEN